MFGGTFDPVHNGHLAVADHVRQALALDRFWFLPAALSPLKHAHPAGHDISSFADRVAMLELAIADRREFLVSRFEAERPAPSFTVDTLTELRRRLGPAAQLFFIVGADAFLQMPAWKSFERLTSLANLVVLSRPSYTQKMAGEVVGEYFRDYRYLPEGNCWQGGSENGTICFLNMEPVETSSTAIREMVRQGRPIADLVPAVVETYIRRHGLYRD